MCAAQRVRVDKLAERGTEDFKRTAILVTITDTSKDDGRYLWLWILLAVLGTMGVGAAIFFGFGLLLPPATDPLTQEPASVFSSASVYDLSRSTLTATGILVGAGAAVIAYRNQRLKESQHSIERGRHSIERSERSLALQREYRTRYEVAAKQIGDNAAVVRLAGVFALGQLASDWPDRLARQSCVDVLCAYLRIPVRGRVATVADATFVEGTMVMVEDEPDKEVRMSIQRLIINHFKRDGEDVHWGDVDIDLTGATLVNADFSGSIFPGRVKLDRVRFSGDATFQGAKFNKQVSFDEAVFTRNSMFGSVTFLEGASFRKVRFKGLNMASARFGAHSRFGGVEVDGGASFSGTRFWKGVSFHNAKFNGRVTFVKTRFADRVWFENSRFHGRTSFAKASFHSSVTFELAEFESAPVFKSAGQALEPKINGATVAGDSWNGPAILKAVDPRPEHDEELNPIQVTTTPADRPRVMRLKRLLLVPRNWARSLWRRVRPAAPTVSKTAR
ncbi:hypothetical protein E3T46_15060 [Cryobacterium sp. Hh11]|uniref:pentapeptide repeat-containing protein n=1 Tax=Cryobacterium sp. Hh11 TaxID=2555868 RepID=UPI001068D93B|nr:pentapeptide repeat-containing protein [Cryobacterium sp. Hh11]TFD48552.1 hypothetical protein E3T46_15060 [Cryobacterium sp. Hh11]